MVISAGIVLIKDGKIGLVKPRGLAGRNYSIPKGIVESGELIMDAALRELREETGIELPNGVAMSKPHVLNYVMRSGQLSKRIFYFIIDVSGLHILPSQRNDDKEIESFNFFSRAEAEDLIYWKQLSILNHISPQRFGLRELNILEKLQIVKRVKHPLYPIFLYNYTEKCKYQGFWNDTTLWCRGLVLDTNGYVVARPFKKFFEESQLYEEMKASNGVVQESYEKLDGALGILFFYRGKPIICTRQSFKSRQSQRARKILFSNHARELIILDQSLTYLFEIIYPENRFVSNYGATEEIFLLDCIENSKGKSISYFGSIPRPRVHDGSTIEDKASEGLVNRYSDGRMVKVKNQFYKESYKRLEELKLNIASEHCFLEKGKEAYFLHRSDYIKPTDLYLRKCLQNFTEIYRNNRNIDEENLLLKLQMRKLFPG